MLIHLLSVFGDGVTITIGSHVWSFSMNFILYLVIAAIVGVIAEYIVGWKVPFGIIGAIIAAVIGIWLMTQVIVISGIGDFYVWGIPLFRALVGAIIFVAIWHLLTYGLRRRRRRYSAA